jgi:hypothetical protein
LQERFHKSSFVAQRHHGIDLRRASGRDVGG